LRKWRLVFDVYSQSVWATEREPDRRLARQTVLNLLSGEIFVVQSSFLTAYGGNVMSQKLAKVILGAVVTFISSGTGFTQVDTTVVAEVNGLKLTVADLEQEESAKLLQAHNQYYQAEKKALEDLIEKRLIQQKATHEGLTVDQLLDRDIKSQVQDPTEDQMKVYYEGLETDQSYEAVRGKILEKIRQMRTDKARAAYVKVLRAQSNVIVELASPSANVNLENAYTLGSKHARVTLVEFADYECPYCQKVAPDLKKLQDEFGDKLAFVFKDFPLPMHSHSQKAAEAARCAGKQGKFWEYHDQLFRNRQLDVDQLKADALTLYLDGSQFEKCLNAGEESADVQRDREEGMKLGLSGTPSFFVNGHFYSGALDYTALHQIVEQQIEASPRESTVADKSSASLRNGPSNACVQPRGASSVAASD
jgi:protein-disulfide isomerase